MKELTLEEYRRFYKAIGYLINKKPNLFRLIKEVTEDTKDLDFNTGRFIHTRTHVITVEELNIAKNIPEDLRWSIVEQVCYREKVR